ncbi:MAG: AMP-binding protein, partial [Nocardioides sp.]
MFGLLTLPALLRSAAERFGDHPAYVEGTTSLSYADLLERVRATARGYVARGLAAGDRVVLWGPNSTDWAVAALAVTYAGGTLVPVNSRYTGHEVADVVDRTGATLVVAADGFLGRSQLAELRAASALTSVRAVLEMAEVAALGDTALDPAAAGVDPAEVEARADAVSPDDVA